MPFHFFLSQYSTRLSKIFEAREQEMKERTRDNRMRAKEIIAHEPSVNDMFYEAVMAANFDEPK